MFLSGSPTWYSSVTNRWRDWWFSTDPAPSRRRLLQSSTCTYGLNFADFGYEVLSRFQCGHTPQGTTSMWLLLLALRDMKARGKPPPLFRVELDSRCTGEQLERLRLNLKDWSYEQKLARFVIMMSTTRGALGLSIPMGLLRVTCVTVDDFSEAIARVKICS